MPLISIVEANKNYLNISFNLELNKGNLVVISGTNGTGKSTLVKLIVGFIKPDNGYIIRKTKKITYLSEHQALPLDIYVSRYLKIIQKIRKGPYNQVLFREFDIPYNKKIKDLSKGNKQKLSILSTIIGDNDIYVFDEPLSGLDNKSIKTFESIVRTMKEHDKAVVISIHKPEVFDKIVDKSVSL